MSASPAMSTSTTIPSPHSQPGAVPRLRAVPQPRAKTQLRAAPQPRAKTQLHAVSQSRVVPQPRAESRPGKPPRLRLTRRGRIVLIGLPLVLLAALILSLAGLLNSPAKAADTASGLTVTPAVSVTVQPGESLWAIAGKVDPDRDPRDVIADIVQLNDLQAGKVMPGQQLFVPHK